MVNWRRRGEEISSRLSRLQKLDKTRHKWICFWRTVDNGRGVPRRAVLDPRPHLRDLCQPHVPRTCSQSRLDQCLARNRRLEECKTMKTASPIWDQARGRKSRITGCCMINHLRVSRLSKTCPLFKSFSHRCLSQSKVPPRRMTCSEDWPTKTPKASMLLERKPGVLLNRI